MNLIYTHQCDTLAYLIRERFHCHAPDRRCQLDRAIAQQRMEMDSYLQAVLNQSCLENPSGEYRDTMREFIASHNGDEFSFGDVFKIVNMLHPAVKYHTIQVALHEMTGIDVERLGHNRYRAIHQHDSSK